MNFLAHLFLSCEDEMLLVGNFLGDFVRNQEVSLFDPAIQKGVHLHRKIDSYTDRHPTVLKGVRRMYADHSKYAPVVIDVFYDYFLSRNWSRYAGQSLRTFINEIYQTLDRNKVHMPEHIGNRLDLMVADDWLLNYSSIAGMTATFSRMKRRVSKPEQLENVIDTLLRDEELLNEEFNQFFPEVIEYVRRECSC